MRALFLTLLLGLLAPATPVRSAPVSELKEAPGIKRIQLVTDVDMITPGEAFTVALVIEPLPGYHTYWKGPGIVGVATSFEWTLPEGFTAGEVIWPAPGKVDMAGITAYGYKSPVMLLTEIQPPGTIDETTATLRLKSAWMACATSCNPGVADFSLSLPVNPAKIAPPKDPRVSADFESIRNKVPAPAPDTWTVSASLPGKGLIHLDLTIPGLQSGSIEGIYFFCHDMQVDSDAAQQVLVTDPAAGRLRLTLVRPEFAPASPDAISGVIYCPGGWPGTNSPYVEISTLWPRGAFKHEQP